MQLIVFSWVSSGLILALLNAHKPFSATGLHPGTQTEGVPPDPLKSVYSIKCLWNAPSANISCNGLGNS